MTQFTLPLQQAKHILDFLNSFGLIKNENINIRKARFQLLDNNLLIAMVNQHSNLEYSIPVDYSGEKLVFFVGAETLVKLFNSVKSDIEFTVNMVTRELNLKYGRSKSSIRFHTDTLDWFIPINIQDYSEIYIEGEVLKQCLKEAAVFKASLTTRPVFLNILLNFQEEYGEIASSDTFSFYKNKLEYCKPSKLNNFNKVLIIPKVLPTINNILKGEVVVKFNEDNLVFETGCIKLSCRVADGLFPDYNKILPQVFEFKIKLNVKELSETIRQVLTFNEDLINNKTSWSILVKENTLTISAEDSKKQLVRSDLDIDIAEMAEGVESIDFRINGSSILDYLAIAKEDFLTLSGSIGKPVVLSGEANMDKIVFIAILKN